jgi:hypothetical protein
MQDSIVPILTQRIYDANAKHVLEDFLRERKWAMNASRDTFRVSGTREELVGSVAEAIRAGVVTVLELRDLVDRIEESGGQHIFLFHSPASGLSKAAELMNELPPFPAGPTEALYSEHPAQDRIHAQRTGDVVTVKQFRTAYYWSRDETASSTELDRIVDVRVRRPGRAVNMLRISLSSGEVELRISRVAAAASQDQLCAELIADFQSRLGDSFDFHKDCAPLEVWRGFPSILRDKQGTFIAVDEAKDSTYNRRVSSRRATTQGQDVRDAPNYDLADERYVRDYLSVHWRLYHEADKFLHTHLSKFKIDCPDCVARWGKVFVAAKVHPVDLANVLHRIRTAVAAA